MKINYGLNYSYQYNKWGKDTILTKNFYTKDLSEIKAFIKANPKYTYNYLNKVTTESMDLLQIYNEATRGDYWLKLKGSKCDYRYFKTYEELYNYVIAWKFEFIKDPFGNDLTKVFNCESPN